MILNILFGGYFSILLYEIKRRFYSKKKFYCLKKDLNNLNQIKKSNIDFSIREMTKKDFDAIFTDEIIHSNANEYKDYLKRKILYDYGFDECYVSVDKSDTPIFIQWIMNPEEENKIDEVFQNGIPVLADNEVLFEGAYTKPGFRQKKIMSESLGRFSEIIKKKGKHFLITYVEFENVQSLKACINAGFYIYKTKTDMWRYFKRHSIYISEESVPYQQIS